MAWVYLLLAGAFEVVGVIGMNRIVKHKTLGSYAILVGGFAVSFTLLGLAMETLPMGIAYAVWTGIGTVGGTLLGMFVYGESKDWKRIAFIAMIVAAVVGLRLTA